MGESLQTVMEKASKRKMTQQTQKTQLTCTSTIHDADVVLADWYVAIAIPSDTQPKSGRVGTRSYLPPEVFSGEQPFDTTCDV